MPSRSAPLAANFFRRSGACRVALGRTAAGWALWLVVLAGLAAPFAASAQHFSFRQYAQAEGLANLAASYLIQARNGEMWIGTDSGVFLFDGVGFTGFERSQGLFKEPVRGIVEDPAGRIWVAFDRGLFVGGKNGFAPVATAQGPVTLDFGTQIVFLGDGGLLITVKRKVVELKRNHAGNSGPKADGAAAGWSAGPHFSASQLREVPALDDVRSLFEAPDGSRWVGCGRGICRVAADGIQVWGPRDGVPEADWTVIRTGPDGRLWARSATHMVVREIGAAGFESHDVPNGALNSVLKMPLLVFDAQGRVLTRTAAGIARWDGTRWREFTVANGLPGASVTSISSDADGDLWLSVLGLGLWHWRGYGHLESWTRAEGMNSDSVWEILRDPGGRLVFGSDHGCEWLDEAAARVGRCPFTGLPDQQMQSLKLDDTGGLWFGLSDASIWRILPGQTHALPVGTFGMRSGVSQITFDPHGQGWIGGNANGLHQLDRITGELRKFTLPGDPSRVWESTLDAQGRRCVATTKGLYRVVDGHAERVSFDHDDSPAGFVSMTSQPGGGIWATSVGHGLLHAPLCEFAGAEWIQANIVAKTHAYFVRVDRRGWVWVGTDQGIAVFDGSTWQRLDAGDGLVWNDTNANAFFEDADGSVWIGTSAGMTHVIDPEGLIARRHRPLDLRIAAVSLGEHPIKGSGVTRVPWERDASFDLRFASHSHGRSANTEFQYRLLGLSPKWLGSRMPEVHLPALEPGSYRLEARMNDPDHAQQSPVVVAEFVVVPPWWRSIYFHAALASLLVATVTLAWRGQVRRLHARRLAVEAEYQEREALLYRATRDGLTGLWNRSAILEILAREVAKAQRTGLPLTVAMLDVDHFKRINDSLGHLAGDDVLRELGGRVNGALRQSDWIGRYGGEELLAVLPGLTLAEAAAPVERLRECVAERAFSTRARTIAVTLSIGVAPLDSTLERMDDLIASADAALYEAKRTGRNRVVHAPGAAALALAPPVVTSTAPVET